MTLSFKSIASWTVLALMLIQFIPLNRINPPSVSDIQLPDSIKNPLKKACYDCHSNETRWRGPAYFAPASWVAFGTVASGRNVLNFSTWDNKKNAATGILKIKIQRIISDNLAHQRLYYLMEPDARLKKSEVETLLQWLSGSSGKKP